MASRVSAPLRREYVRRSRCWFVLVVRLTPDFIMAGEAEGAWGTTVMARNNPFWNIALNMIDRDIGRARLCKLSYKKSGTGLYS